MCHEKNKQNRQGEEFKRQVQNLQRDQEGYQTQLTEVVQVLQDRLKVVEQNNQENINPFQTPFIIPRGIPSLNTAGAIEYKDRTSTLRGRIFRTVDLPSKRIQH